MAPAELSKHCAQEIQEQYLHGTTFATLAEIAEPLIRGAIQRALDEQVGARPPVAVESGHVSVDVGTTAKGEYTYSAKVVMPIGGAEMEAVEEARERAQWQLARAEAFLKQRYGRTP